MPFQTLANWQYIEIDTTYTANYDIWVMGSAKADRNGSRGFLTAKVGDVSVGHAYVHYYRAGTTLVGEDSFTIPVPKNHAFVVESTTSHPPVTYKVLAMIADTDQVDTAGQPVVTKLYDTPKFADS